MWPEPARDGFQSFAYDVEFPAGGKLSPEVWHCYIRRDSKDHLTRLVVCRGAGICEHSALLPNYVLSYTAQLDEWQTWTTDW
jgi:hypothetical protein